MRGRDEGWDRAARNPASNASESKPEAVPGKRTLVEKELGSFRASASVPSEAAPRAQEARGELDPGFDEVVQLIETKLAALQGARTPDDRGRASDELEQALVEANARISHPSLGTLLRRMRVMAGLVFRAQLARGRNAPGDGAAQTSQVPTDPVDAATVGTQGRGGPLPHLDRIQASFGRHNVSGVRAHVGGPAAAASAALGAKAFAHGDAVGFAAEPDLHTAAHEAAHTVQQREGVQLKSIDGGASDPLERHADAVADAVVAGHSAEALLDAHAGAGRGPAVQRKGGETDTAELPDDKNFLVLDDGSVLVRTSWLLSDPGKQVTKKGELAVPSRMAEILTALRASALPWIDPAQIPTLSHEIGLPGGIDPKKPFGRYSIGFSIYQRIGPPPGVDVIVARQGNGLAIILRQSVAIPGPIDTAARIELTAEVRDKIVTALEHFTSMPADPGIRNTIINGDVHWPVTIDPSAKGIYIPFAPHAMEELFGQKRWQGYLKQPTKEPGSGVLTGKDGGRERQPQWLPKGALDITPKLPRYITGSSVQVELRWDLSVHPQAGQILLANHCEYEWSVTQNGKVVDHEGTALLLDNRSTSLALDGGPGTYEVSVVATSDHFLTPDHAFRADVVLQAINEKQFDRETFDQAATGKDAPFTRDAGGKLHLKPHQHALSTKDEIASIDLTEGAIDALEKKGKLTTTDHDTLKQELEKQRATLEEIAKQTAGGTPYIVRGTFVSREDSTSTPLKLLMHVMHRGTTDGQGEYTVLLHDTTFGDATQHPGSATGPVAKDVNTAYQQLEVGALDDMGDHFHAHNDYPSGTIHLAAQQLTSGKVWEHTLDTDNGRKTAKKILGGIAMVGGIALMIIPGGGFVSAAVFAVTATAGVGSVALEVEDRYAKEGELKFDRRLALDVLQVVAVALPFGTMTRVLAEASAVARTSYLLSMTAVDAAQGFLIAADVRDQLKLIDANTAMELAQATSEEQKQRILADRDRKVAQVVGGAMVNGAFILISIGGGIKRIAAMTRAGAMVQIREPVAGLASQGREAMQQALDRGWFEHTNESGQTERVALADDERAYLKQELSQDPAKQNGTDASDSDKQHAASRDNATESERDTQSDQARTADKGAEKSNRITEPVPGLYESIDPNVTPPGWHFQDSPPHEHPDHPGWIQIRTNVTAPDGSMGWIERSYDPKTKMLVMENAFLKDLPSWIEAGKPMKEGKGTPTVAYLTMRQMKMLGAQFGDTRVVKMSTIQNIEAVMQLEQLKRNGVPYESGVAKTHSVMYATTSIQQSGQVIADVRIDMSDAWPWQLSDMMDHFRMPEAERQALFSKYGLTPNDEVMVNYDIYIDLAPYPRKP